MIFASKAFLVFLPVVLLGYHALSGRAWKYRVLLAASWLFYAQCSPRYLWVIVLLTGIDYLAAIWMEDSADPRRRKIWLGLSVTANLGLLAAFKYSPFVYDNAVPLGRVFGVELPDRTWSILLPLGISFHTFQGISYTVDVYRGRIRAVRSFPDYALFVAFFPQLAAGPIVRAVEFLPQMATPPRVTAHQIEDGLHLVLTGLVKKLLVADWLDQLVVTPVFDHPAAFAPAAHRWAAVAWAVQIYCDFSAYSDIARGLAKWFGFEFPLNFNLPYLATSIADFWRRWHLSFSTWLRDYLYFPLGGSRGGPGRANLNLLIVFVLCGLWHGATWHWVAYGLVQSLAMIAHRTLDRAVAGVRSVEAVRSTAGWAVLGWAATMTVHVTSLVLVRARTWDDAAAVLNSFVPDGSSPGLLSGLSILVPVLIGIGLFGHVLAFVPNAGRVAASDAGAWVKGFGYAILVALLIAFGPAVGKSFIYIQF